MFRMLLRPRNHYFIRSYADKAVYNRTCKRSGSVYCVNRPGNGQLVSDQWKVRLLSSLRKSFEFGNELLEKYIAQLVTEFDRLQNQLTGSLPLSDDHVACELNARLRSIAPVVFKVKQHRQLKSDILELNTMISGSEETNDSEMSAAARSELFSLETELSELEDQIISLLIPDISYDERDIILEVSAGVGGQEAMLFTKEVFEMYLNYAQFKRWHANTVSYEQSDLGGLRHAVATVSGLNVFKFMKFEGGVHRFQRVPKTEKSGRMHTSTVTVAVLAQPSEIDIVLNPKDLRIDTCRASGKGGQHVNTTDSAVRIVHLPTGTVAECQIERSQIKNREVAMSVLRSRLYDKELSESQHQQSSSRKLQIGSAGRSEKIRTYNMRDDRVTDHRVYETIYGVEDVLRGGRELDNLISTVLLESRYERLFELLQQQDSSKSSFAADVVK